MASVYIVNTRKGYCNGYQMKHNEKQVYSKPPNRVLDEEKWYRLQDIEWIERVHAKVSGHLKALNVVELAAAVNDCERIVLLFDIADRA